MNKGVFNTRQVVSMVEREEHKLGPKIALRRDLTKDRNCCVLALRTQEAL